MPVKANHVSGKFGGSLALMQLEEGVHKQKLGGWPMYMLLQSATLPEWLRDDLAHQKQRQLFPLLVELHS